ncbi:MAG: DUF5674 family protein [Actinobacteria bacterium]|nr:DUF5674 family protein [Actinomycetota bacterium]
MVIIDNPVPLSDLQQMAAAGFGDLVKAVVDVERRVMVVDAELHADEEALLLFEGSRQQDLWGINLYPGLPMEEWIEFDSMINIRPYHGNRSRGIDDAASREKIRSIVESLVIR